MPPGETSPYSALSAMAIDPQFITLDHVEDFAEIGGEAALEAPTARASRRGTRRAAHRVRRGARAEGCRAAPLLRAVPSTSISLADTQARDRRFVRTSRSRPGGSTTTRCFARCMRVTSERAWSDWPEPLRDRISRTPLAEARAELADEILYRQYLQWLAGEQWARAHAARPATSRSSATCRSW